jgi:hypothetical protein
MQGFFIQFGGKTLDGREKLALTSPPCSLTLSRPLLIALMPSLLFL